MHIITFILIWASQNESSQINIPESTLQAFATLNSKQELHEGKLLYKETTKYLMSGFQEKFAIL